LTPYLVTLRAVWRITPFSRRGEDEIREHYPADDRTRPAMREAYIETRALYESLYGSADLKMWPEVEITCGDSYSGLIPSRETDK